MKIQKTALWLGLILIMVLFSSCMQGPENATTLPSEAPSLTVTSVIPRPSFTPLPMDSPTPASTPILIPTLSVEEARPRLLDLLANNGACRLPCLWGIAPGNSSFQDAQVILVPFSNLSHSVYLNPPGPGDIMPRYTEGDLEIYTRVAFITDPGNNIVNRVAFNAEAHRPIEQGGYEDIFDSKFFGDKISIYALPHVLSEQGDPSSVMIATFGGPLARGGTGGFDILLLYPEQGILVNYTTQMYLIGENVRGCPPNAHVEMELYPPGQSESFFELLKKTDWAVKMNYYQPLEEVTSLSVEEFYQMFRDPTDKCIETPATLWPIPEP